MTPETRVVLNLALCVGVVAVLWTLAVVLCRERVKRALRGRGLTPLRIRWRPLASGRWHCCFRVEGRDDHGAVLRGDCSTPWLGQEVRWPTGT